MGKRFLILLMAVTVVALSSTATKIYVCGTKITGTTSFQAGGGTVSYNDNTRVLTITGVSYTKTGSSNNGISVDDVSGALTINLVGNVTFDIKDADAVLCKSGKDTYINISGNATFICRSSSHAGLKLQDGDVGVSGSGSLTIEHTNYGNAVKGGSKSENLTFQIYKCELKSGGSRLYNLNKVTFASTGSYGSEGYSTYIVLNYYSSNNGNAAASSISNWDKTSNVKILKPFEYYNTSLSNLTGSAFTGETIITDVSPVAVMNSSYFPDANFRSYLLGLYPKGYITSSDVNSRTSLYPYSEGISSLTGVSYFSKLTYLDCSSNSLTSLPSLPSTLQTLNCSNNKITSFNNLQNCSSLKTLNCSNNQISSTSNLPTNIETLNCSSNKFSTLGLNNRSSLKSLIASNNTSMTTLNCYSNALTSLDVSGCSSLTNLDCKSNQLTSLGTLPTSLQTLNCSSNKLSGTMTFSNRSALKSLNISYNTSLTTLYCYSDALTTLNVTGCSALAYLDCHSNQITSLGSLPNSLQEINCSSNKLSGSLSLTGRSALKTLNIGSNPNLTSLDCYSNALTTLYVTNCSALATLNCYSNSLTSLDMSGCSSLTLLDCKNNKLTSLSNVPTSLQTLDCSNNKFGGSFSLTAHNSLKTLNISNNSITILNCYSNALTTLNLSGCSSLTSLDCRNNQLTALSNLPTTLQSLYCSNNKLSGTFELRWYRALKTLDISNNKNLTKIDCDLNALTSLNASGCTALTSLSCYSNDLTSLNVTGCSAMTKLDCSSNDLTSLNVSSCTALTTLDCYFNDLTSLNVSGCSALTYLSCSNNEFTSLGNLPNALRSLYCSGNNLTTIDISNLVNLEYLYCYANRLTSIEVANKTKLKELNVSSNRLTSLNVQGCSSISFIGCEDNRIKDSGMDVLVNSLRTLPEGETHDLHVIRDYEYDEYEGNVITDAQVKKARSKRWIPKKYIDTGGWEDPWVEIPVSGAEPGDVNGDGVCNAADVTALYNWILSNDNSALINGDQNGDDVVNAGDVTTVYNIILGN